MLMSGYKQTGSSQMFLQSVFTVRYWGIFCIYMLSALTITAFSGLGFLYTSATFLLKHSLRYMRNIRLSKRYALSKNVSANNSGTFPKYDMLYSSSSDLQSYCIDIVGSVSISNGYGLYPFPYI